MAKAQPFYNNKKMMPLFLQSMLNLPADKTKVATNKIMTMTSVSALQAEEPLGNDSNISSGIGISDDVRTLSKQGRMTEALHVLHLMDQQGIWPDASAYASLLQGCVNRKALSEGKLVHAHMIETEFKPDIFLGTKLVIMHAKCGSLVDGRRVLDELPTRNVVSWTAMIAAYSGHGHDEEALALFCQMQRTGIQPDQFAFASVLPACANLGALEHGKEVHESIIRNGFQFDVFLGNALVDMYSKCGSIENAHLVFDKMPERNVVSWTALIGAYARHEYSEEALRLFDKMRQTGIEPNQFTFASVLPAYADLALLEHGKEVHEDIIKSGFEANIFVGNSLLDMYVKCRSIENARQVFDKMHEQNVVSWNAMIAGYAQNGYVDEALKLFQEMPERNVVSWTAMIVAYCRHGYHMEALALFNEMQRTGIHPDHFTFPSILLVCANLAALEYGKEVHEDIIRRGFPSDVAVGNALVDMYAKCGSIEDAQNVFDKMLERDMVSWNTMVAGYAQNGDVDKALKLFQNMPEQNVVSWNAMIAGYAQNGHVNEALNLFQKMPERNVVSWTAMIAKHAQNEHVDDAQKLSQKMPERDMVSWNAMIAGYVQNGYFNEALKLFKHMRLTGVKPNSATFLSVLSACANLAVLKHGREVHEDITRNGFGFDTFVENALIDMYAKCGSIENGRKVFDKMPERVVVSWNSMIIGYAMHGCGKEAVQLFEEMHLSGTKPNHVTFIGLLSACCHAGLVIDGWRCFDQMSQDYHITPAAEHYCCMVDLLGRAGCLDEAQDFINKMPIEPNAAVWRSLLGACRIHSNKELGERVAERLCELDPKSAAHYVLLSNIYARAGRWDEVEKVRKMMKDREVKKMPGSSWIEVNNKVHAFIVGDKSHPQTQNIYAELERLSGQMKEAGYMPDKNFVLHDVEDEQKEHILCHHSEKLAIAFGLINTPPGTSIQIFKNLRVCGDCHSATKFISLIIAREIVVRDANRFHHFKDGMCSCGDYW
eukprot:Gb_32164 [translate_table: standard]